VARRRFGGWSRRFQVSEEELAALVALPDTEQTNFKQGTP